MWDTLLCFGQQFRRRKVSTVDTERTKPDTTSRHMSCRAPEMLTNSLCEFVPKSPLFRARVSDTEKSKFVLVTSFGCFASGQCTSPHTSLPVLVNRCTFHGLCSDFACEQKFAFNSLLNFCLSRAPLVRCIAAPAAFCRRCVLLGVGSA